MPTPGRLVSPAGQSADPLIAVDLVRCSEFTLCELPRQLFNVG